MANDKRRHAALMCFENREYAHAAMQILTHLGYGFIEHPELIDPLDENTVFLEASKPVPADADERTEAGAAFQEISSAMGHLGSLCEAGIVGADEKVVWFEEKTQPAMTPPRAPNATRPAMSIAQVLADKILHTAIGADSDMLFEALSLAVGGAAVLAVAGLEDENNPFKVRIVQSTRVAKDAIAALQREIADAVKADDARWH
jgi:hypothetical protein